MLKVYKTARGILTAAIRDIQAGQWCKATLAELPPEIDDEIPWRKIKGESTLLEKPVGCAMGLCSMHGDPENEIYTVSNGRTITLVEVNAPNDDSPPGELRAIDALYEAIPIQFPAKAQVERKHAQRQLWNPGELALDTKCQIIASYNDRRDMDREAAEKWFTDALAVVKN